MQLSAKLITLSLLTCLILANNNYTKYTNTLDPHAKCLDGSSPALYVHQGSQPQNILITLIGGGTCVQETLQATLEDCAGRSKTLLGSSLLWPPSYDSTGLGILDVSLPNNQFASWTKLVILYCDGTIYQGYSQKPVDVNGTQLYFRGSAIMKAHFKWIDNRYNLNKANKIVLTGFSAGGFGTYLWIDYLRGLVSDPNKVYGVVDSAMYINPYLIQTINAKKAELLPLQAFQPPQSNPTISSNTVITGQNPLGQYLASAELFLSANNLQLISQLTNSEAPPNSKCVASLSGKDQYWKCLFTQYAAQYLQAKMLWLNWQYDEYIIKTVFNYSCLIEGTSGYTLKNCSSFDLVIFDLYRSVLSTQVIKPLIDGGHSVWSIACSWHSGIIYNDIYDSCKQKAPYYGSEKFTVKEAFQSFVIDNRRIVAVDEYPWPSNKLCAF